MRNAFFLGLTCLCCFRAGSGSQTATRAEGAVEQRHRGPIDVALCGDGRRALIANHLADSVSLVDLERGTVLVEEACGRKPVAVAVSTDGKRAAVSNLWSGTITLWCLGEKTLEKARGVAVGGFPRGLVFGRDGASLFAAVAANDEVMELDWATGKVTRRWPAPREPRTVALSADGRWLAAASSRSAQVRCWDLKTGTLHWERTIGDAFNLRGLCFTTEGDAVLCAHSVRRDFPVTKENIEKGWVIDSRLTRLALKADVVPALWQIALDTEGAAVSDLQGLNASGHWLTVTSSGTRELLLLATKAIGWNSGDPGDFIAPQLLQNGAFRRLPLGGRPMGMALQRGGKLAVIANYLLDEVQVIDASAGWIVRSIALGPPQAPDLARQGEALFYDARRSHHQWFSCHTCHVDGHTCELTFDTLNDDTYGTPKLTPSLYNVTRTGPWTWHGRQQDLAAGVAKSFTTTLFGPKPTRAEIAALLAFLDTLVPPPNTRGGQTVEREAAIARGRVLFKDKAGCSRCHRGPYYTSPGLYDVKLDAEGSLYKLWNPPSLVGLHDRGPYLHDGRAKTLDEVLQKHHTPAMVGGEVLTDEETLDLRAFLLAL